MIIAKKIELVHFIFIEAFPLTHGWNYCIESMGDSPKSLSNDKRHKIDEADLYNSKTCGYHSTQTVLLIYKKSN